MIFILNLSFPKTRLARQSLISNKQQTMIEIDEANYEHRLGLLDQKNKLFQDQRPNLYMRWFRGIRILKSERVATRLLNQMLKAVMEAIK